MSKSLGNVIDPLDIIEKYGTDALRYFLAREVNTFEDSDITMERFKEAYNANLANGLGNLVSRIMKMAETHLQEPILLSTPTFDYKPAQEAFDTYNIQKVADLLWGYINALDVEIQKKEPFKMIKIDQEQAKKEIKNLVKQLWYISFYLEPFLPETSQKIKIAIQENKMPEKPLFPRID